MVFNMINLKNLINGSKLFEKLILKKKFRTNN